LSNRLLECVEIETGPRPEKSVVWLHGLGASGHDFEPILPYLGLPASSSVRFVFPHAPEIPVTLNMGMVMPAWYDIVELDLKRRHDEAGVRRSQEQVLALMAREQERGTPSEDLVLAGFSQGGAVALYTALRFEETLAGCLALSTYLVGDEELDRERSPINQEIPIFQGHGRFDPMVPLDRGEHCRDRLVELGYRSIWREYPMQHEVCMDEIVDVGAWLTEVLRLG